MNEPPATSSEPTASTDGGPPASSGATDLANRPSPDWLDAVEAELGDVDLVLKCLARDSATMCSTCSRLDADGQLADRTALARCAETKQPR